MPSADELGIKYDNSDRELISNHAWWLNSCGYACANVRVGNKRKTILMHRVIVGHVPAGMVVDHINRDRTDNRRSNLRVVSYSENARNIGPDAQAKRVGKHPPGVSRNRDKWQVVTRENGKLKWHGSYANQSDAVAKAKEVAPWLYSAPL